MGIGSAFLRSLRPRQWSKNLLLFAGVIFARELGDGDHVVRALLGACVFCLGSGVIYVFNDMADVEQDQLHPVKRFRPIAAGQLPVFWARRLGWGLLVLCLAAGGLLGWPFFSGLVFFFLWNLLYTRWLKRVPIVDVTGIGMSFVIRATAGVLVLLPVSPHVRISPWLLLCTFFLSLFLGFCKRRDEFLKVGVGRTKTRPVLRGYTEPMLNALIGISFGLTLMMYGLYTVWPDTVAQFGTMRLVFTIPFVLAGMGRYLYLVYEQDRGGRPHEILLNDLILQLVLVGWIAVAIAIIGT